MKINFKSITFRMYLKLCVVFSFTQSYLMNNIYDKPNLKFKYTLHQVQSDSIQKIENKQHPIINSFKDLSELIGGSGKAKIIWEDLKLGIHPIEDTASRLSGRAKLRLHELLNHKPLFPVQETASSVSSCGTRKMLIQLEVVIYFIGAFNAYPYDAI